MDKSVGVAGKEVEWSDVEWRSNWKGSIVNSVNFTNKTEMSIWHYVQRLPWVDKNEGLHRIMDCVTPVSYLQTTYFLLIYF